MAIENIFCLYNFTLTKRVKSRKSSQRPRHLHDTKAMIVDTIKAISDDHNPVVGGTKQARVQKAITTLAQTSNKTRDQVNNIHRNAKRVAKASE